MINFLKTMFTGPPFSLHIAESYLQVAQLKKEGDTLKLVSSGHQPLPAGIVKNGAVLDQKKLAAQITNLLTKTAKPPIKGTSCNLVFPDSQVYSHIFYLPLSLQKKELKSEVDKLVEKTFPIPFHEIKSLYRTYPCGKIQVVSVTAARREIIAQYYEVLKSLCKLTPVTFEPEHLSLLRNLNKKFTTDTGTILIDVRGKEMTWFTLWKDDVFDSGTEKLNNTNNLLASKNSFKQKTGRDIKEVILSGAASEIAPIKESLKNSLALPITLNEKYVFGTPDFKISCGLALREVGVKNGPEINFLKN